MYSIQKQEDCYRVFLIQGGGATLVKSCLCIKDALLAVEQQKCDAAADAYIKALKRYEKHRSLLNKAKADIAREALLQRVSSMEEMRLKGQTL